MPLDPQAAAYLRQVEKLAVPPPWERSLDEMHEFYEASAPAMFGPAPELESVQDANVDGVPVRVYRPAQGDLPGMVLLHGGGWVLGSLDSHDPLCRALASRSGRALIAVGYRLSPEHPYPAAVEDAWTVTEWAAKRFSAIGVFGDSAGGQLAAATALHARDAGVALALQVLVYPVLNHAFDTPSYSEHGHGGGLTEPDMRWFWAQYVQDATRVHEPYCSPLRTPDLSGLPRTLVLTAEYDPLRDEGEAFAHRLEEAGVPVTLHRYTGLIHGFIRMAGVIDRSTDAIDEVAAHMRSALA